MKQSIKKILFLSLISIFLVDMAASAGSGPFSPAPLDKEPSFLILIADDAGLDLGCYGNPAVKTPNLDRLAGEGMLFEKTFLTSPQCSPSRISIMTGKYPHTTRTEDLHTPLPEGEVFFTSLLQEAGYFTGHNGKTHWGPRGNAQFDWYSEDFDHFEAFLDAAGGDPFFFWTGFFDPHRDYQENTISQPHDPAQVIVRSHLVDDARTRKDIALYYDEIARMDSVIGAYIDLLKKEKKLKNTYVIFLSDNGAPFPREKGTLYDRGIQTPLLISGPEVPSGETYDGLTSSIDLAPTLLELAGIEKPEYMPGISFAPVLLGEFGLAREYVFSERNWHDCDEHMRSVRTDRYKLILNAYTEKPHGTAADLANSLSWFSLLDGKKDGTLTLPQQLIFTVPRPAVELYDLSTDPEEYNNLAFTPESRSIGYRLIGVLNEWMQNTDDFPPTRRTRMDHTDRITGFRFYNFIPELENDIETETDEAPNDKTDLK